MRVYFLSARDTRFDLHLSLSRCSQQKRARNVIRAIHDGVRLIAEHPQTWQATNLTGIRVKVVRQYPFKIFYRVLEDKNEIEIVHVRHSARRPWQSA